MRKRLLNIITIITLISFLFGINGISMAVHHCSTHGHDDVSFFHSHAKCGHQHQHSDGACCELHEHDSLVETIENAADKAIIKCCSENEFFLKILDEMLLMETVKEWSSAIVLYAQLFTTHHQIPDPTVFDVISETACFCSLCTQGRTRLVDFSQFIL